MSTKIKPLSDKVLIKPLEPKTQTAGGLLLPDDAQEEQFIGVVVAVGPGKFSEAGNIIKPGVDINQKVLIRGKWAGDDVTVEGVKYKVVNDSDILAVIED